MGDADARFLAENKRGGIMDGKFEQPRRSLGPSDELDTARTPLQVQRQIVFKRATGRPRTRWPRRGKVLNC